MCKKLIAVTTLVFLSAVIVSSVYAAWPIKLIFNGSELTTDVPPKIIDGRVLVPIRAISEALGADVYWDDEANSVKVWHETQTSDEGRIEGLERALAPKDAESAVSLWAEGVKTRNGALQYALMSSNLKEEKYSELSEGRWSTGTSSPWVESYEITELPKINDETYRYEVEFVYTDSTQAIFKQKEYVTVKKYDENWFISSLENVDIKGEITKITLDEANNVKSIFVEDKNAEGSYYDKATLAIESDTQIFKGYTNEELDANDLKEGDMIEAVFNGPVLMIYPVQGGAKIIRVF